MSLVLVLDNVRSAHNVGSLWRTADAAGVTKLVLCGISPHPPVADDPRPAYVAERAAQQIAKTALGAETTVAFDYRADIVLALAELKTAGYKLCALEQAPGAISLTDYQPPEKVALVVGHERTGIGDAVLAACDDIIHLPMKGKKESLNVSVAGGIALYYLSTATSS